MAAWVLSVGVQTVDAVLVKGGGLRAVENVVEPRWVRKSEDAVPMWMLAEIRIPIFTFKGRQEDRVGQGLTKGRTVEHKRLRYSPAS